MSNITPIAKTQIVDDEQRGYVYYEQPQVSKIHHFYITHAIKDPELYIDMVHTIKACTPNDTVYIYLNTPGGRLDTTLQIINALRISQAKIITVIEAEAHSAGTMLFLCADEFVVHENSIMMFHNFSGGAIGKGNELKLQIDAVVGWFNKMAYDIYHPFLTLDEIDDLIAGKDIWMEAVEIRERLKNMVELISQERQEAEDAAEAEEIAAEKAAKKADRAAKTKAKKQTKSK